MAVTIGSVARLLILCTVLLLPRLGWTGQYDLGGPCEEQPHWKGWKEIRDAENSGEWDRAVVFRKEAVRAGCSIQYRWYGLVNALVQAHRAVEASSALRDMDSRGFDVNPALIDTAFPAIVNFMASKVFDASPLGVKLKRLEKISDERRIQFEDALNSMSASEKPPENYVAKGACPFECCRYRDWAVLDDTQLVASPGAARVIGTARKGSGLVALTGEVHLRPEPVLVLTAGDLPKDSIAFVLDYVGEGHGNVSSHGKVVQAFWGYAKYCFHPSQSCWGETLLSSQERKKPVWWVKLRLPNGVVGWSDKSENFGNKDGCG